MPKPQLLDGADYAKRLHEAADTIEDAQRARQHLWGIITYWQASSDDERLDAVCAAFNRLQGIFEAQGAEPTYYEENRAG